MYVIVYCGSDDCDDPGFCCSFYRMALGEHGIKLTEDKGKNDTSIGTVNPITEDYNLTTQSPNQTAFMGDHQPQGQTIWIPITIAVVVILVTGLVIIVAKKRKWFRSISSYFCPHEHPEDRLNKKEQVPAEEQLLP